VYAQGSGAYIEITLKIENDNRGAAVAVYEKYKQPFLDNVGGAESKQLLVRDDDVQVLHGFATTDAAHAYLQSEMFTKDVVGELGPLLAADPEVRIYMTH
jgi:hypothetical protein